MTRTIEAGQELAYRSGNMIGEEENGEGTEEFTKVRATNNDLGPSAITEDALGKGRSKGVLQEPVEVEGHSVSWEEPCNKVERLRKADKDGKSPLTDKPSTAEDDEETNVDGLPKIDETPEELDQVVSTLGFLLQIFDSKTGNVRILLWY